MNQALNPPAFNTEAITFVLGFIFAFFLVRRLSVWLSSYKKTPTHVEYWVYSTQDKLPDQNELMKAIVGANPYVKNGINPIGPSEGLVFSDVRFKIALVLKTKNQQFFSPATFEDELLERPELAEALQKSESIIKIQYSSNQPVKNFNYLQMLPHAVMAASNLTGKGIIFDAIHKKFYTHAHWHELLSTHFKLDCPEAHVLVNESEDHSFSTLGLTKIGLRELETLPVPHDLVHLTKELLSDFISQIWSTRSYKDLKTEKYGDQFILQPNPVHSVMKVRIHRIQESNS